MVNETRLSYSFTAARWTASLKLMVSYSERVPLEQANHNNPIVFIFFIEQNTQENEGTQIFNFYYNKRSLI